MEEKNEKIGENKVLYLDDKSNPTPANLLQMKWEPRNSNTHFNMAQAS